MVKRLMSAVLKQKFLSGDENFGLEFTLGSSRRVSSPLRRRTKEGGRAVLRDVRTARYALASSARATPYPSPPLQEGAGALTPSILPECSRLRVFNVPARSRRSRRRAPEYVACGRG
jgi:hypothetical protein